MTNLSVLSPVPADSGISRHSDAALIAEARRRGLPIPEGFELAVAREALTHPGTFASIVTVVDAAETALKLGLPLPVIIQAWTERYTATEDRN